MSEKQKNKGAKRAFKLTKRWIVSIAVVVSIALLFGTIAIVKNATANPGIKVLKNYINAAKSQDIEKMASTFYSKKYEKEKYNEFVEIYKQGKSDYKDFMSIRSPQDQEVLDFLNATEKLNLPDDRKDYGLRLVWEQKLAKKLKNKISYSILSQDKNQIKLSVRVTYTEVFLATNLPKKYANKVGDSVKEILLLTFRRNSEDNKWYFASDFRLTYGQNIVDTWCAPYNKDGLEVKRVNPETIVDNTNVFNTTTKVYDLTKLAENIVSIGSEAFANCEIIEKLIIPEGLVNIGWDAFRGCSRLKEIVYPDGSPVTLDSNIIIGEGAFRDCKELKSFQIPSINKIIPNYVFFNCQNLQVKTEGSAALSEYNLFEGVTAIGHYAFYGCKQIEKVIIPDSVTSIGDGAFENCANLKVIGNEQNKLHDNIVRLGTNTFKNCSSLTSISLPKNIKEINIGLFNKNTKLSTIELPETLISIGNYAFAETALTEFIVPSTVEKIGQNAFFNVKSLEKLEFEKDNNNKTNIKTIGDNAFNGCEKIVKLNLPESIKSIGKNAFVGCNSLRSVMVDFPVETVVGETIFTKQAGIPKIYVKSDASKFARKWYSMALDIYSQDIIKGDFAIKQETRTDAMGNTITENVLVQYLGTDKIVTLDTSITRIGDGAFSYSKTLEEIVNFADLKLTDVGLDVFAYCNNLKYDIYGSEAVGQLKYLGNWLISYSNIDNELDLTDRNRYKQGTKTLPDTIGIAASAFANAELTYIKLPKELKYISEQAFKLAVELTKVEFEQNSQLIRIGNDAFYSCDALDHIILPSTVKEIGDNAFGFCTNLRYVMFNSTESVSIGKNVFTIIDNILKIYINGYDTNSYYISNENWKVYNDSMYDTNTVHTSGDYTYKLLKWTDENGVEQEQMTLIQFLSTGLTQFKIPTNIERIGVAAFAKSQTIQEVEIHAGVKRIEKYAFYSCSELYSVVFKAQNGQHSLEYIGTHAFRENAGLADQDGQIVFEAIAPNSKFSVGDEPFDAFDLDRKVKVGIRDNYEQHPYWKENRDMLNAADDPKLILQYVIIQGNTGSHQNTISPEAGQHSRAPGFVQNIRATEDSANGYKFVGWYNEKNELITKENSTQITYGEAETVLTYIAKFSRVKAWAKIFVEDYAFGGDVYLNGEKLNLSQRTNYRSETLIDCETTFTVKVNPFVEYDFIGWFIGDQLVSDSLEYTVSMGFIDIELEARFERVRSWAILTQQTGGTVELISQHDENKIIKTDKEIRVLLALGESVTFRAVPNTDYEFAYWTVNGVTVEGGAEKTFVMNVISESNMPIVPKFEKKK